MKKVICVKPWTHVTVGKVYDVLKNTTDSICEIIADNGSTIYCGAFDGKESHFRPYVEPASTKQSVTIEVPEGYKIKSQKVVDNQIVVELEPLQNIVVVSASDTVLTIKPEYLEKLKALGVYERWLSNVKAQYDRSICSPRVCSNPSRLIEKSTTFFMFIDDSFGWEKTTEGSIFWAGVAVK